MIRFRGSLTLVTSSTNKGGKKLLLTFKDNRNREFDGEVNFILIDGQRYWQDHPSVNGGPRRYPGQADGSLPGE